LLFLIISRFPHDPTQVPSQKRKQLRHIMTDIDSKVEEMQKKTKIIAREVADYVFQSFLFLPEELQEWKSIMRRPRRLKGVGFRKTRLFVGQPREKWSCCHCQSNDDLRSSACPSQSDFDTRLS